MVADMGVDMVADMDVDMVADMVVNMEEDTMLTKFHNFNQILTISTSLTKCKCKITTNFTILTVFSKFHVFCQISQCSNLMRELVRGVV